MRTRTIALVVALALAPAGAFADRHPLDCFGGYLVASDSLKAVSISCGFYTGVVLTSNSDATSEPEPQPSPPPPPPPPPDGTQPPATDAGAVDEPHETFIVPEFVRFTGDRDGQDFSRNVVSLGARRYFGRGRVQPYAQVAAGFAQTSHLETTDSGWALGGSAGLDAKLAELGRHDLVFRASCGVVRTFGAGTPETVGHCSPNLGIRFNERKHRP